MVKLRVGRFIYRRRIKILKYLCLQDSRDATNKRKLRLLGLRVIARIVFIQFYSPEQYLLRIRIRYRMLGINGACCAVKFSCDLSDRSTDTTLYREHVGRLTDVIALKWLLVIRVHTAS